MLCLKKVYKDELFQLALLLSLLRVNQDSLYENDIYNSVSDFDFDNGTSWRSITPAVLRSHYVNPKSLDSVLLNYERELFADLNSLGSYTRGNFRHPDVTAYLLNIERNSASPLATSDTLPALPTPQGETQEAAIGPTDNEAGSLDSSLGLTQEDMDLIEVLWKQDVDLGFSLEAASAKPDNKEDDDKKTADASTSLKLDGDDDIEKLKTLKAINEENVKEEPDGDKQDEDIWAGLDYTIDTETGEYVIKGELDESLSGSGEAGDPSCDLPLGDLSLPLPEFLLDEALRLVELDDENNSQVQSSDSTDMNMIQTPQFHHPHHRAAFQSRMPFVRSLSMEQGLQDLANLLSIPPGAAGEAIHPAHHFGHHHHHHHHYALNYATPAAAAGAAPYAPDAAAARGVLLHNATLAPPMGDINATYPNLGGTNLGNAVATSMNLTNSSEPMGEPSAPSHYKLEPGHDMYYQNGTSELNQTDGFLSSILNDEDLQLMDMAMNEGMYTMRMMDSSNAVSNLSMSNTTATNMVSSSRSELERIDTSSDSAVSSMGSERVPSLSDGEWGDAGSDSGHTTSGEHYDYQNKFRYNYANRHLNNITGSETARIPPVAQKKHQMYGKRYFQEQGAAASAAVHQPQTPIKYEYRDAAASAASFSSPSQPEGAVGPKMTEMKYSCSVEFNRQGHARSSVDHIQHNHTYHLPAENSGSMQRPVSRDKKSRKAEEEHLTRDEKRARALSVPIAVDDIINLPMDEFNERLSKYDLSEAQLSLIRDIRRRGKNKVAAQNCRKRKLDQILSLADEVKEMRDRKMNLLRDHEYAVNECKRMKDKYQQLYRHVFQNLRDPDGNQYSPYQFSLQTSADGNILMVPRSNSTLNNLECKEPHQNHKD